jgi:hypothetical protein
MSNENDWVCGFYYERGPYLLWRGKEWKEAAIFLIKELINQAERIDFHNPEFKDTPRSMISVAYNIISKGFPENSSFSFSITDDEKKLFTFWVMSRKDWEAFPQHENLSDAVLTDTEPVVFGRDAIRVVIAQRVARETSQEKSVEDFKENNE